MLDNNVQYVDISPFSIHNVNYNQNLKRSTYKSLTIFSFLINIWSSNIMRRFRNVSLFASGASKSPLWCQIVADVMGLPVKVPVVKEATALGAAIMAGYGAGVYGSIEEAADSLVKWEKTYLPNGENHETYSKMYAVWREFYHEQLNLSDRRVTRYMCAAPGLSFNHEGEI
jgi:glycerol kinase